MNISFTLLFGLFTSICTVIAGKFWDTYWSKRADDKKLHYLSIRLMFLFDGYAETCVNELIDNENASGSDEQIGRSLTRLPEFPSLPEGDDYKLLDQKLLVEILGFPHRKQMAASSISTMIDFCDHDQIEEALIRKTTKLGTEALKLAEKIRVKYKLPNRDLMYGQEFDSSDYLKGKFEQIIKSEKAEKSAEVSEDLSL
jgi:hypothetical protein